MKEKREKKDHKETRTIKIEGFEKGSKREAYKAIKLGSIYVFHSFTKNEAITKGVGKGLGGGVDGVYIERKL